MGFPPFSKITNKRKRFHLQIIGQCSSLGQVFKAPSTPGFASKFHLLVNIRMKGEGETETSD